MASKKFAFATGTRKVSVNNNKLVPCLVAGAILGVVLWVASGMLVLFPIGLALGLLGLPILAVSRGESKSRKRRDDTFRD